ncbi:hypothetical protein N566_04750 [Streptomycetaceae bacterium MP113-05]|nr:hypothetical protein N566_04750 [Streptomycetaceae bacterium MP113-05]
MTLLDVYERQAARSPSSPALLYERAPHSGTVTTWAGLVERARAREEGLRAAGLLAGGRCAVVMTDHPDLVPTVLAVWRAGAVVVPVDSHWGEKTLDSVLRLSRAGFVADPARGECLPVPEVPAEGPELPPMTAMISYTSGSTSDPKGVVLTHDQLLHAYTSAAEAVVGTLGRRPARFGVSMRMSGLGILGMNYLWPAVMGMPVVVLPELSLSTAAAFWEAVDTHGVELTYLVPPLVELLNRVAPPRTPEGPAIACLSGGASLSDHAHLLFQGRFGALLLNVYGLTEVSFAAFFGDRAADGRGTPLIGPPVTVEARLRGADGRIVGGAGEGELELRGSAMSCGYYDNPEANRELVAEDGWLRSGDLALRDLEGRYRIIGRRKNVVLKGGFTVYLHEVEEAANTLPDVLESAALRLDLPSGEDIGLLLRLAPSAGPDVTPVTLHKALLAGLGRQRSPRRVVLTDAPLPRLGQEKIDRRAALAVWNALVSAHERKERHV